MEQLGNKGYTPSTPQQILDDLTQAVEQNVTDFENFPPELRGNLLYEGACFVTYFDHLITMLFNGYAPSQANEVMFANFANDRGLRQKGAYYSQVDLKFTGQAGTLIPKGLQVANADKTAIYQVLEEAFIGSTGTITLLAYSDSKDIPVVQIGDLNQILLSLPNLTVTNVSQPTQPQEQESFELFKARCQARWRNAKAGSYEGLINAIRGIEGVDQRTCGYAIKDIQSGGQTYKAINVVVGGGDPQKIAEAMYYAGSLTSKAFLSAPSGSESSRTINQNLYIFGNTHTYAFTRPKLLNLDIEVRVSFVKIQASNLSVEQTTKKAMQDFINSHRVGEPINKAVLRRVFVDGTLEANVSDTNIKGEITFTVKSNSSSFDFNGDGFLPIEFDQYCVLRNYSVIVNA